MIMSLAVLVPFAPAMSPFHGFIVVAGILGLLSLVTARLGSRIPSSYATVGSVAVRLSRYAPPTVLAPAPTRDQVREEVHRLMAKVLRVDVPFTDESRFADIL
ncbi:MAG: hypothetical protein IT186_14260 [Acidobacteria bacterium]|nr:hypothetical protein [Acidobacteriota bacterium]